MLKLAQPTVSSLCLTVTLRYCPCFICFSHYFRCLTSFPAASQFMGPGLSPWPRLNSLFLRTDVNSSSIQSTIDILRGTYSTSIREVTVQMISTLHIPWLLQQYRKSSIRELLADLEKALNAFPTHRALSSPEDIFVLNLRRTISWKEEWERYIQSQQNTLLPTLDFRYCRFNSRACKDYANR